MFVKIGGYLNDRFGLRPIRQSAASRSISAIRGPQAGPLDDRCPSTSTIRTGGSLSREKMRSDNTRTENYLMGRLQPIDFIR